jgi:superfamily II DNA or RNA helicase
MEVQNKVVAEVTADLKFIKIVECSAPQLKALTAAMRQRIKSYKWDPKVKRGTWDGYISFMNSWKMIPIGLYGEFYDACSAMGAPCEILGMETVIDHDLDWETFQAWCNEILKGHATIRSAYDYQIETAYKICKFRYCMAELATAAGKTLILYLVFAWLKSHGKINTMCIVVPTITLISQTEEEFLSFSLDKQNFSFTCQKFHGGEKKILKPDSDIIIGTFQTLANFDSQFWSKVDSIAIDEAHHTNTKSIKTILSNCLHAKWRFGVSGTIPKGKNAENFTVQSFLGPIIANVNAQFLIENGYATPVNVKVVQMRWLDEAMLRRLHHLRCTTPKEESVKLFSLEKQMVIDSEARFAFVCSTIAKSQKNGLVLFQNIKQQYGKRIFNWLKENTSKTCFYVDGNIDSESRSHIKAEMEKGTDSVCVASFGTFKQGISIKNIHNIFFVESYKSEIIIRQSVGRGMRLLSGKESVTIIDFVDDLDWVPAEHTKTEKLDSRSSKAFSMLHSMHRNQIYASQNWKLQVFKIDLK